MKAIKRIFACAICLCLVLGCMSMTAFADEATGSITVENQSGTNASVAGKTLNLFKIFSATSDGENISYQWVTADDGTNLYESFFFGENGKTATEVGTIHDVVEYINRLKDDSFAFSQMAAALHEYIHENNITADATSGTIDASATSYTFSGLDLGYYLIYDATTIAADSPAVRSAAMLVHPGENKVIKLKADRPNIVKYVDDSDTETVDWKISTTASIGETVTFRIATMIPNHDLYGKDYTFVIEDKMADELELVPESIKVTITEAAVIEDPEGTPEDANTTYEIITDAAELNADVDFKVEFTDITDLAQDSVVEIIYDAVVTKEADFQNLNTAILTYSNDPNNAESTGSVESSATVLLWQFTLTKYMEDASGNASSIRLAGAEFEIYAADNTTAPLTFSTETVTSAEGVEYTKYILDSAGTITTLKTLDSGDDGKTDVGYTDGGYLGQILIFGLGEGSYVIRETKAPAGYQIAKGDFSFTLTDSIGTAGAIADATITQTRDANETPGKFSRVSVSETDQKYYIGITNAPGSALPETGGIGTTIFTIIGVVLMAGAVAFFATRKKSRKA